MTSAVSSPARTTATRPRQRIRIAFIGCVAEGRRTLETLLALGEEVVAGFTLTPELAAKTSGAVRWDNLAERHRIPLHEVSNINDPEPVAIMHQLAPDLVFCVGWTQLVRREILDMPRLGCIGFHASLLPRNRGRAPVNWAIINGEKVTGNTMILLDEGVDTGDIIAQRAFPIEDADTCATVYEKVAQSEEDMIREVMPLVHEGRMPRRPQNHDGATLLGRRRPEDGVIDWSRTTDQLYDWVRALTHPYPGAFTWVEGSRVWVWKASRAARGSNGEGRPGVPGRLRLEGGSLLARTGDGDLVLESVQREGEPEVPGPEFAARWLPEGGCMAESPT